MAPDQLPTSGRSIAILLASTPTIQDAHPAVLHQLLEFSHRYTSQVLSDALVYAEHAGRAGKIEMEDVSLAVQARVGWEFGGRVPKEVRHLLLTTHNCSFLLDSVSTFSRFPDKFYPFATRVRSIRRPPPTLQGMSHIYQL